MSVNGWAALLGLGGAALLIACSSGSSTTGSGGGSTSGPDAGAVDAAPDADGLPDAAPDADGLSDAGDAGDPGEAGADAAAPPVDALGSNRDRLLGTYLDYLKTSAATPQSNGLSGTNVSGVCDLWQKLDPSARAVFLTLTARMQGSILGDDGSSMLWHVTRVYRISGGQNATATDPGSCGGAEYNRLMMSMDAHLHAAQAAASAHAGAVQGNGKHDLSDIPASSFWRDSHDLGGAHAPFDQSDETEGGAPRGQTQYFADPAGALANAPLDRLDLVALVDPYALEMDQDYDCVHASNPLCTYITYGPFCLPKPSALGTDLYTQSYGTFDPGWQPSACAP
jgi:hypothetical protein